MKTLPRAIGAITLVGLLALTGCGSDSDSGDSTDPQASESAPAGGPGSFDSEQFDEIRECLSAAGLDDVLPSDMPTDRPTDMPSDPPSDFPSEPPTDVPSDGPGGGAGFGALNDPDVQEALEACGINLPQTPQNAR